MAVRTAYPGTQTAGQILTSANFTKLPGGWLGYVEVTASQTGIGAGPTDLTSLTLTVTAGSSRRLLIEGYTRITQQTSSGAGEVIIRDGASTQLTRSTFTRSANDNGMHHPKISVTPSAGSNTYKLSAGVGAGTIDIIASSTQPAWIMVTDVGPSA